MITLLSLLVSLLLIAMAHEGGHWVAARLNTVTVPLVHIGVGPHLVQFEAFGTRWRLGLLPLGGYTRVHGMLNSDARVPVQGDYRLLLPLQRQTAAVAGATRPLLLLQPPGRPHSCPDTRCSQALHPAAAGSPAWLLLQPPPLLH
jgi:membrane-associated protease RseP (regulator of RpoE activity)